MNREELNGLVDATSNFGVLNERSIQRGARPHG
jgi:hypothetical protein